MSDTRSRLLAATAEALRQDGIAGLTAASVAERAGVDQALVLYHFGSLSELLATAARDSVDAGVAYYRERFAALTSFTELLRLGRDLHGSERELGNLRLMAQLMAGAQADLALAEVARYAMARWTAEIERVVGRVIADGPLTEVLDPQGLAQALAAAFVGLELYDGVDPVGGSAAADSLESLVGLLQVVSDLGPVASRAVRAKVSAKNTKNAKSSRGSARTR